MDRRAFLTGAGAAALTVALPPVAVEMVNIMAIETAKLAANDAMAVKLWSRVLEHEAFKYVEIPEMFNGRR